MNVKALSRFCLRIFLILLVCCHIRRIPPLPHRLKHGPVDEFDLDELGSLWLFVSFLLMLIGMKLGTYEHVYRHDNEDTGDSNRSGGDARNTNNVNNNDIPQTT